jgi:hypothetical protein
MLGPGFVFSFVIFFTQSVGLLRRVISPSQGRYIHTGQHEHRIKAHTDIHALMGIRTHDPSVRASEDSTCLRPRGHWDRQSGVQTLPKEASCHRAKFGRDRCKSVEMYKEQTNKQTNKQTNTPSFCRCKIFYDALNVLDDRVIRTLGL